MDNLHKIIVEVGGKVTSSFEQAEKKLKKLKKQTDDLNGTDVKIDVDTKGLDKTLVSTDKLKDSFGDLKSKGFDKLKSSADDLFGAASPLLTALGPAGWLIAGISLVSSMGIKMLTDLSAEFTALEKKIFKLSNNKDDAEVASQLIKATVAQFENVTEEELIKTGNAIAKAYGISQSKAIDMLSDNLTMNDGNTEGFGAMKEQAGRLKELGLTVNDMMSIVNTAISQGLEPGKVLESVKESADALYNATEDSKNLLSQIGLDQDKLVKDLKSNKLSIYDVDKLIMEQAEKAGDSQLQQLVMANFFKSAGEDISLEQLKNSIKYSKSQDKIVKSSEYLNSLENQRRIQLRELIATQQDASAIFNGEAAQWGAIFTDLQINLFKLLEFVSPILLILNEVAQVIFKLFSEIIGLINKTVVIFTNAILFSINALVKAINLFKKEKDQIKEIEYIRFKSDIGKIDNTSKNKPITNIINKQDTSLGLTTSSSKGSKSSESNNSFGGSGQKSIVFNIANLLKIDTQTIANNMDLKTLETNIINLLINSINTAQVQF